MVKTPVSIIAFIIQNIYLISHFRLTVKIFKNFRMFPGAGVPEFPLKVIIENHEGRCFSRDPTMKSLELAIMDELRPPQQDIATQIGTIAVPAVPMVLLARSVATAGDAMISAGVKTARYATLILTWIQEIITGGAREFSIFSTDVTFDLLGVTESTK